MKAPSEALLATAEAQLSGTQTGEKLLERRNALTTNLDAAINTFKKPGMFNEKVSIPDYTAENGDTLDLVVGFDHRDGSRSRHRGVDVLEVRGSLRREGVQRRATFPMYRIGRHEPTTDSGYLTPFYEISVADPESDSGYTALALVEQQNLINRDSVRVSASPKIENDEFDVHGSVSPEGMAELKETGLYVNPHGQAMIEEAQYIAGLIAEQNDSAKE